MGTILTIILTIVKWCIIVDILGWAFIGIGRFSKDVFGTEKPSGDIVDEMFTDTFDGWKNVLENLKEAWF